MGAWPMVRKPTNFELRGGSRTPIQLIRHLLHLLMPGGLKRPLHHRILLVRPDRDVVGPNVRCWMRDYHAWYVMHGDPVTNSISEKLVFAQANHLDRR